MIKGHANNLKKLQLDIQKHISMLQRLSSSSNGALGGGSASAHGEPKKSVCSKFKKSDDSLPLVAHFRDDWFRCLRFELCDAANPMDTNITPYVDINGKHVTHIYSYNKVMSIKDRRGITKKLNRTNFQVMAWYFSPRDSANCGLKSVKLAHKMPMQSTGREKFTVYIYFKTRRWEEDDPWSEDDSDDEDKYASDAEEGEEDQYGDEEGEEEDEADGQEQSKGSSE